MARCLCTPCNTFTAFMLSSSMSALFWGSTLEDIASSVQTKINRYRQERSDFSVVVDASGQTLCRRGQ